MSCKSCDKTPDKNLGEKLKELLKNRVKSVPCPYLKECQEKVLKEEVQAMCKDEEVVPDLAQVHAMGLHIWQRCPYWNKMKRDKEGKLPRDW
jgi:hypothetical protein